MPRSICAWRDNPRLSTLQWLLVEIAVSRLNVSRQYHCMRYFRVRPDDRLEEGEDHIACARHSGRRLLNSFIARNSTTEPNLCPGGPSPIYQFSLPPFYDHRPQEPCVAKEGSPLEWRDCLSSYP